MSKRSLQSAGTSEGVLRSTAEAAFASDRSGRITAWNAAAEGLLGHPASVVLGKRCFQVIRGRDPFGNRFCDACCAVRRMWRHGEPIHPFHVRVATAAGEAQEVRCSVTVAPGPQERDFMVIHLIQPIRNVTVSVATGQVDHASTRDPSPSGGSVPVAPGPASVLTPREVQVLRLVAGGNRPGEIARSLGIANTTVDNHIQNILRKLEVDNKLRAVFVAARDGLI